jgi:VanZ family protein
MRLKFISWIPAAVVMVVIFLFSANPAESSNESSKIIASQVVTIYENITNVEYDPNTREKLIDKFNHIIRKSAHFSEFALLAWCICLHLMVLKRKGISLYLTAVSLSALYAATDEIHQYFVPARSCQLRDVLIDTCGAATGALFFFIMLLVYARVKRSINKVSK